MKTDYLLQIINMLRTQLQEEEESYQLALKNNREFHDVKDIKRRIKSLRKCIHSITIKLRKANVTSEITIKNEVLFSN